jgi:hypothetical protein
MENKTQEPKDLRTYISKMLTSINKEVNMVPEARRVINNMLMHVLSKVTITCLQLLHQNERKTLSETTIKTSLFLNYANEPIINKCLDFGFNCDMKMSTSKIPKKSTIKHISKSNRCGLIFSVARVKNIMKNLLPLKITLSATIYMTAILQCICADLFTHILTRDNKKIKKVTRKHIKNIIQENNDMKLLFGCGIL